MAVDIEGLPLVIQIHEGSVQDRNGVPIVVLELMAWDLTVEKAFADGGYAGPKLAGRLKGLHHYPPTGTNSKTTGSAKVWYASPLAGVRDNLTSPPEGECRGVEISRAHPVGFFGLSGLDLRA